MEVFGAGERENDPGEEKQVLQPVDLLSVESKFLSSSPSPVTLAEHYRTPNGPNIALSLEQPAAEPVQPEAPEPEEPTEEVVPAVGTVLLKGDDGGEAPPEKYSLDYLSFGGLETTTPVLGNITSAYGYRTHPIKGNYQFHGGLDIGGQAGEPIHAFAAGTVEYIGKNDSYGLYLQLDHGSGIKSFYAHCKSLCVKKGQTVTLGETIGTVGSSGSATGPHLHLELKYNGLHLDPAYYVQPVSAQ